MPLHGAMMYVKDLNRMKRFYSDLLRAEPANQDGTDVYASFDAVGVRFALHAIPGGMAEKIEIASPPVPREDAAVKLVFAVNDVEAERERLESLGIVTVRRPWQQPGESCDAVDPEGNLFQICRADADLGR